MSHRRCAASQRVAGPIAGRLRPSLTSTCQEGRYQGEFSGLLSTGTFEQPDSMKKVLKGQDTEECMW